MSSKHLSIATIIDKNRIAASDPFLVLLEVEVINPTTKAVVETFRLARNSEDINYQGFLYAAMNFEIELKQEAGAQSSVNLKIVDYTRGVQERMQAYGGGIGSNVKVIIISAGNLTQPPEVQEFFSVTSATAASYVINWTLGTESILSLTFPKRKELRDRCAWRYKSAECKYAGPLGSCDLTLQGPNGCGVHNNSVNFGGFPGMNGNGIRYG